MKIKKATENPPRRVDIREWNDGAEAFAKNLNHIELVEFLEEYEKFNDSKAPLDERYAAGIRIVTRYFVDKDGVEPLFDESQSDDIRRANRRPFERLCRLLNEPRRPGDEPTTEAVSTQNLENEEARPTDAESERPSAPTNGESEPTISAPRRTTIKPNVPKARLRIAEWVDGVDAYAKELDAVESAVFFELFKESDDRTLDAKTRAEKYVRMATIATVDADGNRLFSESDVPALMEASAAPTISLVAFVVQRRNAELRADLFKKNESRSVVRVSLAAGLDAPASGFGNFKIARLGAERLANVFRNFRRSRLAARRLPRRAPLLLEGGRRRRTRRLSSVSARRKTDDGRRIRRLFGK